MIARDAIRLMVPPGKGGTFHPQQVYQPFARVTEAGYSSWVYKGGPRLAPTYTGDWDIPRRYPFLERSQWQFDTAHMAEQRTTLRNLRVVGGVVGGLVSPATLALNPGYGVKTLYGANCIPPLDVFGYCDYGSPVDRQRQLYATEPPLTESQRGTAFWLGQGNSIHYDDFTTCATLWFYGGGFGTEVEQSFSVPNYGALLRSQYANDAAYLAASTSQTRANHPPHDQAWRRHMLRYCLDHALQRVRPMHLAAGIESSYNGFAAIPSTWGALCNVPVGASAFDNLIVELNPADTEPVAGYQLGHDLADTTRLLTWFARVQLACATVRAFGAKATVAPYPYIRAVPPNTQGDRFSTFAVVPPTFDDFPPTASTYTEPVTVAANYRVTCAWALANGCMPTVPIQVFDYITNFLTGWQSGNRWQWTADPVDFQPLFDWIGMHRAVLFDGFDTPPQIALAVPDLDERYSNSTSDSLSSSTNSWVGAYEVEVGPGWDINRLKRYSRDIVAPLMTRGLPWMLSLLGPGLDATRTAAQYPFADMDAVIKTEPDATYTQSGAAVPAGGNVQARAWLTGTNLDPLRTVVVNGASDATRPTLASLRAHPDGRVAVHLVNTNNCTYGTAPSYTGAQVNARQSQLRLRIRQDVLGSATKAHWYEPGQVGGRPLRVDREPGWVELTLPGLMDNAVVLLSP
ncbi:MAG: hypothetical protein LW768_19390 [Rubrivivax sp.]|jgi:hypothetical protein|nr:hypothetical protein [Rubrivivax sp.]